MRIPNKIVFLSCFFLFISLGIADAFDKPEFSDIKLYPKFSFPTKELEKKDIYLYRGQRFSSDSVGNIYVTCLGDHQILKFDSRGDFVGRIGREGQGPGEFQGPNHAVTWKNRLIVLDNFRRNIQILDTKGVYIDGFVAKSCWDLVVSDSGLICIAPALIQSDENSYLTEIYSQEGEMKNSFGKPKDLKRSYTSRNRTRLATNNKDELIMAFQHWPIIRKYSLDGELKAEYTVEHKIMKENAEFNQLQQTKPSKVGEPSSFKRVIDGIDILGGKVYLLFSSHPDFKFEILELDKDMNVIKTYTYKHSEWHYYSDFLVKEQEGEMLFYILQSAPDNRVDVFGIKQN